MDLYMISSILKMTTTDLVRFGPCVGSCMLFHPHTQLRFYWGLSLYQSLIEVLNPSLNENHQVTLVITSESGRK